MKKLPLADATFFEREGFTGKVYISSEKKKGYTVLLITVEGKHPKKEMKAGTIRNYFVIGGTGTFIVNNITHKVSPQDLFVIEPGDQYEYEGTMTLLDTNISPDNSFKDVLVENALV